MYRGTLENWLFVFFNLFPYGMDLQSNSNIENIKEKFPTTGKIVNLESDYILSAIIFLFIRSWTEVIKQHVAIGSLGQSWLPKN